MQRLVKKIRHTTIGFASFAFPLLAATNNSIIPAPPSNLPTWNGAGNSVGELIMYVITNILLPLAGIIAVLFIIIGGYQYIFSGANESLAEKGKTTLTNSVIGLVIIIMSYVIVRIVASTLGAR